MTADVTIRPIVEADSPLLQEYASDEKVARTCNVPHPYPKDGAAQWIGRAISGWQSGDRHTFAILNHGEFVGVVRLVRADAANRSAELDYFVATSFWDRGIATQAARLAVRYAFEELGLCDLTARCLVRNPASARVLQKAGFAETGAVTEDNPDSKFHGESWRVFRLTKSD